MTNVDIENSQFSTFHSENGVFQFCIASRPIFLQDFGIIFLHTQKDFVEFVHSLMGFSAFSKILPYFKFQFVAKIYNWVLNVAYLPFTVIQHIIVIFPFLFGFFFLKQDNTLNIVFLSFPPPQFLVIQLNLCELRNNIKIYVINCKTTF